VAILLAVLAVLRAALRVGWLEPRTNLGELVSRLRDRRLQALGWDPKLASGVVERLLFVLPPYGAGRCVKRSLLLLELWSRAGLEPRLHVGIHANLAEGPSRGHFWVTTGSEEYRTAEPAEIVECWRG
jgi:hypothetical protein